ncbi:MAG: hypothetical protein WCF85_19305, partial [Rhodospirillaceae bacterium]
MAFGSLISYSETISDPSIFGFAGHASLPPLTVLVIVIILILTGAALGIIFNRINAKKHFFLREQYHQQALEQRLCVEQELGNALAESERLFRAVFEASGDAIIVMDDRHFMPIGLTHTPTRCCVLP